MPHDQQTVTVTLGEGVVVLHRSGRSAAVIANILGQDLDVNGEVKQIWLDRLVHRSYETEFVGWNVSGAISSVLTRAPLPVKAQ